MQCPRCKRITENDRCSCGLRIVHGSKTTRESVPTKDELGRSAWFAIHSYSQEGKWDPKKCSEWYYNQWKPMIPSYGCECTSEFKKIELENPPDFSSQEKFYNWGVKVHNLVNKRLGKPQWTASTEKN